MITPAFKLDWTTGITQPGVDVTRAGVATFVGSNGLIQQATPNTQRIDWSTGAGGLLIEELRANLYFYSEQFNDAYWTKVGGTISADIEVSPDGQQTSDKMVESSGTVAPVIIRAIPVTSGITYTVSIYAKSAGRTSFQIYWTLNNPAGNPFVNFDLQNGTASVGNSGATATIQNAENGWYRCTATYTASITGSQTTLFLVTNSPTAGRAATYAGNGTSGVLFWGAQLEVGAFATSYIPTTTTALTRNADVATITGTNFSDFWQASKGGAQVQAIPSTVSGIRPLVQYDDGTANNLIALRGNAANPELQIVDGGASQVQLDAGTIVANTPYSLTGWWQTNDCKARQNSGATVSDYTATIPTVTQARLGSDGTNYLNGHLASISYYDTFSGQIYTRRKNKAVFSLL